MQKFKNYIVTHLSDPTARIVVILVGLVIVFLVWSAVWVSRNRGAHDRPASLLVPENAACMLRVNHPERLQADFVSSDSMLTAFLFGKQSDFYLELPQTFANEFQVKEHPDFFIFWMNSPKGKTALAATFLSKKTAAQVRKRISTNKVVEKILQTEIYSISFSEKPYYTAISDDIWICSKDVSIIKDYLQKRNKRENTQLEEIFAKANKQAAASFFVKPEFFAESLQKTEDNLLSPLFEASENLCNWILFDLHLKPTEILLNGQCVNEGNAPFFIDFFEKEQAQSSYITEILPFSTLSFSTFGMNRFSDFYNHHETLLDAEKHIVRAQTLEKISVGFKSVCEESFLSKIGTEIACFTFRNEYRQIKQAAAFHVPDTVELAAALTQLVGSKNNAKQENINLNEVNILRANGMLPALFFDFFPDEKEYVFTLIGNYLVFAGHQDDLKYLRKQFQEQKTLANQLQMQSLSYHAQENSNIYFYLQNARTSGVSEEPVSLLVQFCRMSNFMYAQAYITCAETRAQEFVKRDTATAQNVEPQQTSQTIQTSQTSNNQREFRVKNHRSKGVFTFVLDAKNVLHYKDPNGKELFKYPLDGRLLSEIHQVDLLKNGRIQYLFNTSKTVYAIDIFGRNVNGFPVKFKNGATNGIAVFDYSKDRDYRILFADSKNCVQALTASMGKVDGFNPIQMKKRVSKPVKWERKGGKDYLIVKDDAGNIFTADRRGNKRTMSER